jgi:hypothetical protein
MTKQNVGGIVAVALMLTGTLAMNVDKMIKAVAELKLTPALSDAKLDPKLVKLVVLQTAKPRGLAEFGATAFDYKGDGSGDVRLRISPAGNKISGRFHEAIDNIIVIDRN